MSEHVTHWKTEIITETAVPTGFLDEAVSVEVVSEAPMAGERRVERRGHRYYPTMVDVLVGDEKLMLSTERARAIAMALLAAADEAERIDAPDLDDCGHWWPCDCRRTTDGTVA